MKKFACYFCFLIIPHFGTAQNYDSYFTGNTTDLVTNSAGGVCLMGGATEDDNAMIWFLNRANGGDILVIRASGSDGYNDYMYSGLGVSVNSVETIVWNDATASNEPYIHQKINQAEAIWLAGGDQWNYVSYWRNTPIDSLINKAIVERNIAIGGTSAGMAILGQAYFSAENGTVTSTTALNDPYDISVTPDTTSFLNVPFMDWVITDTHYDSPDRKGRHAVFLARLMQDFNFYGYPGIPYGIACDEYTAVCVDTNGIAKVFGEFPTYDDNAYFLRTICGDIIPYPDYCQPGQALEWNFGLVVCRVKGTTSGSNTFDLNNWQTDNNGQWYFWHINNGVLSEEAISDYVCDSGIDKFEDSQNKIYPNPSNGLIQLEDMQFDFIEVLDAKGSVIDPRVKINTEQQIDLSYLDGGVYILRIHSSDIIEDLRIIIQH